MNYKLTPLHLFSGVLAGYSIYLFAVLDLTKAGLGGLFPYILFFLVFLILGIDFLLQITFTKRKAIYVVELLII